MKMYEERNYVKKGSNWEGFRNMQVYIPAS